MENEALVTVNNLVKYFPVTRGLILERKIADVKAVDGVSFSIKQGDTLGLVGESGSGKTTVGKCILQIYPPTSGEVFYQDADLVQLDKGELRQMRRHMQPIYQDPYSSLDPRMTVADLIGEPMVVHGIAQGKEIRERVNELLQLVGLAPYMAERYPHMFSGGQRQRIGIARALACQPSFLVCDEPVSALDVSIQAQIVNLLMDLQEKFNLTYLFIAHDLAVVKYISQQVAVMYLGKIMEVSTSEDLYNEPLHPYTLGVAIGRAHSRSRSRAHPRAARADRRDSQSAGSPFRLQLSPPLPGPAADLFGRDAAAHRPGRGTLRGLPFVQLRTVAPMPLMHSQVKRKTGRLVSLYPGRSGASIRQGPEQ